MKKIFAFDLAATESHGDWRGQLSRDDCKGRPNVPQIERSTRLPGGQTLCHPVLQPEPQTDPSLRRGRAEFCQMCGICQTRKFETLKLFNICPNFCSTFRDPCRAPDKGKELRI